MACGMSNPAGGCQILLEDGKSFGGVKWGALVNGG
jgi:hypothetical protein